MTLLHQPFPMVGRRRAQGWRYHPAYRRPRHFHEEPEFNVVVGGEGVFTVGERQIRVQAGSLLWFPPGVDHYLVSASDDLDLFVVGFRPDLLAALAREHRGAPGFARGHVRLGDGVHRQLAAALSAVPASADDLAVEQRLLRLLGELWEQTTSETVTLGHRAAALILSAPEATRDEIARQLASNRGDVSRRFRKDQGMSLSDYRNRLRSLAFLRHLDRGASNLTRAALEAGFGSYSQCHRVCRALFGFSPRDYVRAREEHTTDRFEPLEVEGGARSGGVAAGRDE